MEERAEAPEHLTVESGAPRKPWRNRFVALAIPLTLLGIAELALRTVGFVHPPVALRMVRWSPETDERMAGGDDLHRHDSFTLWSPRPGARVQPEGSERISSMGFRGEDPDPDRALRVLVLGDSSSFGMGVEGSETYAAILERGLSERHSGARRTGRTVQVLNAGIVGSTILQGIARYRRVREVWKPHFVIEAYGVVNEQWPAVDAPDARKLALLAERDRVGRSLREHCRVVHLVAYGFDALQGTDGLTERPTLDELFADPNYRRRVSPEEFGDALATLEDEVRADGGQLVLLRMPRRASIEESMPRVLDYDPVLLAFASESGCPLADGHTDFRSSSMDDDELFWDSFHPNALGHRHLARALSEVVIPLVDALEQAR